MITDPTEMLAQKIANSPTGRRCHSCLDHVMVMRGDGDTLILDAYPTDDGVYSIRADCLTVYRTESGPARYQIHRCEGDRRMTYTDEQIEAAAKAIYGDDYDWDHELSDENEPYTTEDGDAGLVTGKNWYRRAARAALEAVHPTEPTLSEGGTAMTPMKDEIYEIVLDVAVTFQVGVGNVEDVNDAVDAIMALIQDRFTTTDSDTSLSEVPLFTQD